MMSAPTDGSLGSPPAAEAPKPPRAPPGPPPPPLAKKVSPAAAAGHAGAVTLESISLRKGPGPAQKDASAELKDAIVAEAAANKRLRDCDIEAWYTELEEHTFPTAFVGITEDDARALIAAYNHRARGAEGPLPAESQAVLEALEARLALALDAFGPSAEGVFAKLSSRSPKDSTMCHERGIQIVCDKLTALRSASATADGRVDTDENAVIAAVTAATIECLKLHGAADVIACFLTSDRVCTDDLPLALSFPDKWSQHIVLRQWVTIPPQFELRAFVFGRKLTGLAQYYNDVYFPELIEHKGRILEIVQQCFDGFKDKCPVEPPEYSIDIAVDLTHERAYVIELNPFGLPDGLGTGTPLFDLKQERDRAILFGAPDVNFEFRVVTDTQVAAGATKAIGGALRTALEERGLL